MTEARWRLVGAGLALALAAGVLALAGPATVLDLLRSTRPRELALAALVATLTVACKGVRLQLLLPPRRLGAADAVVVAAAAQAAGQLVPARAGELTLPWLLKRRVGWDMAAGVTTLLASRALDLAALGVWAGAGVAMVWGRTQPLTLLAAAALLLPALLLPVAFSLAERLATRLLAPHGLRGRRWLRRLRRVRRAFDELRARPRRLAGAAALSLVVWAGIWLYTWLLLEAMGYHWPVKAVVTGSALGSLANLLPVNLVANLGTLEAGWTAAFVALGFPLADAAASGLAAHLWALLFVAVLGAVAWPLALRGGSAGGQRRGDESSGHAGSG